MEAEADTTGTEEAPPPAGPPAELEANAAAASDNLGAVAPSPNELPGEGEAQGHPRKRPRLVVPEGMSKNAYKRQLKKERFEATREQFKLKRREKEHARRQRKRMRIAAGEAVPNSIKPTPLKDSACKVAVVIDLDYEDFMNDKDRDKLKKQVQFSYSMNRKSPMPLQYHLTSFTGKIKESVARQQGSSNWDIHFSEQPYTEVFPKDKIVYLTSDSDNALQDLDPDRAYIIGGLVDHNAHKGLSHRRAEEKGIAHARLPIDEYIKLASRQVLTVNHVFQILLRFVETRDWKASFFHVIPPRKGASEKEQAEVPAAAGAAGTEPAAGLDPDAPPKPA